MLSLNQPIISTNRISNGILQNLIANPSSKNPEDIAVSKLLKKKLKVACSSLKTIEKEIIESKFAPISIKKRVVPWVKNLSLQKKELGKLKN